MSENLIKYEPSLLQVSKVTEKDIDDYLFGTETKLSDAHKTLFKAYAIVNNLNPFKREIYPLPYEKNIKKDGKWVKETVMSIVTGYQVYLQRAEATGLLSGYNVSITKEGNKIVSAKIVIARKDWTIPFEWEILFDEFAQKDSEGNLMSTWKTKPEFMIKKCAIGTGFRLCFPNQLGSLPYLPEELSSVTYEELQNMEKDILKAFYENKDKVLMSKETKKELFNLADKKADLVKQAVKELNLDIDNLLESDKEILSNKIKELLNANNTEQNK